MANTLEQPEVEPGSDTGAPRPFGAPGGHPHDNGFVSEDARRLAQHQHAEHERHRQSLNLQRENILSQRTSHPARRTALEAALAQIEGQISAMK